MKPKREFNVKVKEKMEYSTGELAHKKGKSYKAVEYANKKFLVEDETGKLLHNMDKAFLEENFEEVEQR